MRDGIIERTVQAGVKETAESPSSWILTSSPATVCLILVNITVFLALPIIFGNHYPPRVDRLGADWGPLTLSGQWWRLLTSAFVHIELFHLLFNMIGLWILGSRLEKLWGPWIFLLFYLSCAFVGDMTVLAIHPEIASYGASVGVLGIAGAIMVIYGLRFRSISWGARWRLAALVLYSTYIVRPELSGGLYVGHAAGLLTGGLLAILFSYFVKTARGRYWTFVGLSALLTFAAIVIRQHYRTGGWPTLPHGLR